MAFPIDIREEAGVRTLHFGSDWIQGAMRIARPWHLELDYTREMMASLLLREGGGKAAGHPPAYSSRVLRDDSRFPRKILLIGLGAASLTKFLYRNYPLAKLTVVEIEPEVVAAARQFFKLPEDQRRLKIVIGDGAEFVASCNQQYDLILVDGFDSNARPGVLDTLPFYQMCRAHLGSNGIMAVNLLGLSRGFKASLARIREAFDGRVLAFPSCDSGNVIVFAAEGEPVSLTLADLKEQARELKTVTGLNLLPTLARLEQHWTCAGGVLQL
jgi:spermidine synthase